MCIKMKKVNLGPLLLLVASLLTPAAYHDSARAATLLPNGEQTFLDENGHPLAAGCVSFFVPGTSNTKDTYTNAAGTIPNTNPVQLDAAGRAIIYGVGTYRQVVYKRGASSGSPCSPLGQQVWDQLTADTSTANTIYAGTSGGTPNAVTLIAPTFTGADGQVINYISGNTNSANTTINPSGFGAVQVVRDGATGPAALTGGELVSTNAVSVIYDANAGTFHILSPVTWPNTSGVPVGTVLPVSGFIAPTNYAFAYGQAVNRGSFAALLAASTLAQTGTISIGSPVIAGLTDTSQLGFGIAAESAGIPGGSSILSCTSTTCTMNTNATASRTGTMTFFPYGAGDGSNTFNLPDYRGVTMIGRDNMGGTPALVSQIQATISTTSGSASTTVSSAAGLGFGMFVLNANVPANTTITNIVGTTITLSANATATAVGTVVRFSQIPDPQVLGMRGGNITSTLLTPNLPPYTPSGTLSLNSGTLAGITDTSIVKQAAGTLYGGGGSGTSGTGAGVTISGAPAGTFIGTLGGGTNIPVPVMQPSRTINFAVRLTP